MEINTTRKQQIEATATEMFRLKGYAATSMRDLAQEINIEAASIYAHVKSKEAILRAICFRMAELFFTALDKVEEESINPTATLKKAIREHVRVITENLAASAVFLNEWRHMSEPYLSEFLKMRENYENRFLNIVRNGAKDGEFQIDDERFVTKFILSSINWTYNWYKPSGKMTPDETGEKLAELLINGIKSNQSVSI